MNDDIKNLTKSVDAIAQTTARILETMATKKDLEGFATKEDLKAFATKEDLKAFATKADLETFKFETNIHFNNMETDLKSFKNDTQENFAELNEKFDDLSDTVMGYDKRIEI